MFSKWQGYLDSYNSQHGTNLSVNDWVNEGFVPIGGDIIVFNGNNKGGANNYYPNSTLHHLLLLQALALLEPNKEVQLFE